MREFYFKDENSIGALPHEKHWTKDQLKHIHSYNFLNQH
jgi:hypothetical protein